METNLRARTLSETRGFVKALVAADSDLILGYTALGIGAGRP
jgi:pyruvate/2-oxoglutarate dehydrogenase complex dihydrolipoamide dehydrogenase (E3) component